MGKINLVKLKEYRQTQKNPALAVFRTLQDLAKKTQEKIDSFKKEMEAVLQKEIEGIKSWLASEIEVKVRKSIFTDIAQIKGVKGDKGEAGDRGEKGDTGQSIKGDRGDVGARGERGLQGLTGRQGMAGKDGKVGKDGKDGKDGSSDTPKDIVKKLESLQGKDRLDARAIKNLPELMGAKRTLHRGGMTLQNSSLLGTGDGTTTTFTLPSTPYDSDSLKYLFVDTVAVWETDDWTRSGLIITFLTAPPSGAKVRNPDYRKS